MEKGARYSGVVSGKKTSGKKREKEPLMKEKQPPRDRWLTIRLSHEEETLLRKLCGRTTCRSLSEYGRNVLLNEPVVVLHRNASADDFVEEMVSLKKEFNALAANFSEAIHRLDTLEKTPEVKLWILLSEREQAALLKKTDEILRKVSQIHAAWWQK